MLSTNRLASEASPYLLQHAGNPVDWWPWCDAALEEAKKRDVPILLSIGYSACHWCHVMEHESFEDEMTARLMNELFVNIKVDREERPDLDQIYQLVVQLMGRGGGWPLTVFLTPAQKPFFGGTYFPPEDRYGMAGFPKILRAIAHAYRDRRDDINAQAEELTGVIAKIGEGKIDEGAAYTPGPDLLERTAGLLLRRFDQQHGGFGEAPKFPNTMPLEVLLRRGVLEADEPSKAAARLTLESMHRGGICDQLGGGFHRYSTDAGWVVPHFEKMLYDNALLLRAYVDGARALANSELADVARAIVRYVEREMTDPDGGFYASQDADSDGEEGKFFVWDPTEVRAALPEKEAMVALEYFGITDLGNFEDHGRPTFKTVLHESKPVRDDSVRTSLAKAKAQMFREREKRSKPFRDEKVLTSWSALMISAIAEAGAALDDETMLASAERALAFVERRLLTRDGDRARAARLCKKVEDGWVVKGQGFLDDHAYLANAALDVYEVMGDPRKVVLARSLVATIVDLFWREGEGFFFAPVDGEPLITRPKDPYDNAVPSGTSMACRALLRLGALVDPRLSAIAEAELARLAPSAVANPLGYGQAICELDRVVRGSVDVVLVGARSDPRTKALARTVLTRWIPNRTLAWLDPTDPASKAACSALAAGKEAAAAPVAYVCRGRVCSLAVTTPDALRSLLD